MIDPSATPLMPGSEPRPCAGETRLRRAIAACGAALWEWQFASDLTLLTPSANELLGWPGALPVSPGRFLSRVHRDDRRGLWHAVEAAFRSEDDFVHEFRFQKESTGEVRWIAVKASVLERGGAGEALVMAGSAADITAFKLEQEARELLNQEFAHRMKNVLSIVGSLVTLSGEHRPEAREFVTSFQARLGSFAATHELLVQADWHPIALGRLVEKVLAPLGALDRVDIEGNQAFLLGSHDAQTLALVLHELTTNAIKHGALSNGEGRVVLSLEVKWERRLVDHPSLILRWEEIDGPPCETPSVKGFGLTLLERLMRRHEQVEQVLEWRPEGLFCCLSLRVIPLRPSR